MLLARSPTERIEWIPPPEFEFVRRYAERLVGGDSGETQLLLYLLLVGIGVAGAIAAARGRGWRTVRTWRVGLVVIWLLAPFVVAVLVSLFQPLLQARYLIVAVPPLAILAAAGLVRLRWAPAVAAGVALLAVMHVADVRDGYDDPNEDWRSAAAVIAPRAERSDTVVVHPLGAPALTYYLERAESPVTDPRYGRRSWETPTEVSTRGTGLWLVLFDRREPVDDRLPPPEEFVGERRALVGEWSVHEVDLMLYGPERSERA